jgi:predicted N-acetyltransferase YhbS
MSPRESAVRYRPIADADGPALEALMASSPDAGPIGFTYEYQGDLLAVSRALASALRGAVAIAGQEVVGMVWGEEMQVQWAGSLRPAVYLSNLRVRPDFRRRGIARGLSDWGLAYIAEQVGTDVVLFAAIQESNVSIPLAGRYGFKSTAPIQGGIIPMRRTQFRPRSDLEVRTALDDDLPAVAKGMNRFYHDHNLWSPVTCDSLQGYLGLQIAGVYPNRIYVVVRGTRIVGGLCLSDRTQLVRMRIARAPSSIRWLGNLLGLLSEDGVLRALTVRRVWFAEGELDAGRYLWQRLRYDLRTQGTCLGIAYDPRDELAGLFQVPFWLPMVTAAYWVRADGPWDLERCTYYIAGA